MLLIIFTLRTKKSWSLKIGIIREGKVPPDARVPMSPAQCAEVKAKYPNVELVVQPSPVRRFGAEEYRAHGVELQDDLSDCDVILGVKEVPIDMLMPNKTHFFFSHTIKEPPYNRDLLRAIMANNIRLVDWETLTDRRGQRLIGFGRYAGIVGCYNGFLAYGLKSGTYELKPAHACEDRAEMEQELHKVKLPENFKIVMTGGGRVAGGALEILDALNIRKVDHDAFLTDTWNEPVYCQLQVEHYYQHQHSNEWDKLHFYGNPGEYISTFKPYTVAADMYVACHYWDSEAPFIFEREDMLDPNFKLAVVADISCDIDGPVPPTIRPSTIANPIYGYNPNTHQEVPLEEDGAIAVMAVDNLPCELPKDASEDFGTELINKVLPCLLGPDPDEVIARATITENGALTRQYRYLQNYVDGTTVSS